MIKLNSLENQWHTFIREDITKFTVDNLYGLKITRADPVSTSGQVNVTWASAKFLARVFNDRVEFRTNCSSDLIIKYLILDQP